MSHFAVRRLRVTEAIAAQTPKLSPGRRPGAPQSPSRRSPVAHSAGSSLHSCQACAKPSTKTASVKPQRQSRHLRKQAGQTSSSSTHPAHHKRISTSGRSSIKQPSRQLEQQQSHKLVYAPFAGQRGHLKFEGELRYATSQQAVTAWVDDLLHLAETSSSPVVVGYDTETRVLWNCPEQAPTSLIQLCYHPPSFDNKPVCLLLPLSKFGLCSHTCQLLSHPNIIKAGVGLAHDMFELQSGYPESEATNVQAMLDLSWLAHSCFTAKPLSPKTRARQAQLQQQGITTFERQEAWGLAGLLESTSEFSLVKRRRVTMSNWAKMPLDQEQLEYAAADAYAGLIVYHSLWLRWLQVQQQQQGLVQQGSTAMWKPNAAEELQQLMELLDPWDTTSSSVVVAAAKTAEAGLGERQQQQQQVIQAGTNPAVAAARPAAQVVAQLQDRMPFTIQASHLTSPAFWADYAPALSLQQQWQQQVLEPGFRACRVQLQRMQSNRDDKVEASEAAEWLMGVQHGDATMGARGGWGEAG